MDFEGFEQFSLQMAARHEQRMAEVSQRQAESAKKIADLEAEIGFHKAEFVRYRAEGARFRAEAERLRGRAAQVGRRAASEQFKAEGERLKADGERYRQDADRHRTEEERQRAEIEREAELKRAEFKAQIDREFAEVNKRAVDFEEKLNQKLDTFHSDSRLLYQAILEQAKTVNILADSIHELRDSIARHAADPNAHRAA